MSFLTVEGPSNTRGPRFKLSDPVMVTVPGTHKGKLGTVVEIVQSSSGDFIHRYRVRLGEGNIETFFGFELELHEEKTA